MAAAAHEGLVCLYSLRTMDTMEKQLREGLELKPIHEVSVLIDIIVGSYH